MVSRSPQEHKKNTTHLGFWWFVILLAIPLAMSYPSAMTLNFGGWKHALGYLSVALLPTVSTALATSHVAHAGLYSALSVAGLGLVAFLCGAQSEEVFVKEVSDAAKGAAGTSAPADPSTPTAPEDTKP